MNLFRLRAAFLGALALALLRLSAADALWAAKLDEIGVVMDGRSVGQATAYQAGDAVNVDISELCRALGGEAFWYQASGRVFCSYRSKQLRLNARQAAAKLGDKDITLPAPVSVRAGEAFVPMAFLVSADFQAFLGMSTRYDADARVLSAASPATIGDLRRVAAEGKTVLELGLRSPLSYRVVKKDLARVDVIFRRGILTSTQALTFSEGPLAAARLEQGAASARLVLTLAGTGASVSARREEKPMKLVIEVAPPPAPDPPAPPAAPPAPAAAAADDPLTALSTQAPAAEPVHDKVRIVLDPGHGGKDSGTRNHASREKDITLAEAKELEALLKEDGRFDVVMTRTTDVFVPLSKRSKMANDFQADLFVSIHVNHSGSSREHGMEVYFLSEKASDTEAAVVSQFENSVLGLEESKPQDMEAAVILTELEKTELINDSSLLAGYVVKSVDHELPLANRGVKQAQFYVLHWTRAPAILIESAFLSNPKDAADLASQTFRQEFAAKIAAGIVAYSKRKGLLK